MYLSNLAVLVMFARPSPDAIPPDTSGYPDTLNPADTLPAVVLQEAPYYIQDASGEPREWLDSCYVFLRELMVTARQKEWIGNLTFEALAKRYPRMRDFPQYRSALFRLTGTSKAAVYVSYLENPGFVPTIALVNDKDAGLLTYRYASSVGETIAWAMLIGPTGK